MAYNIDEELKQKLRNIWDDREFIEGTLLFAHNYANKKMLIDYIDGKKDVSVSDIAIIIQGFEDYDDVD